MAKAALKVPAKKPTLHIRSTGKGVIGAIGKPPGFKVVTHKQEQQKSAGTCGRVSTCGTIYR